MTDLCPPRPPGDLAPCDSTASALALSPPKQKMTALKPDPVITRDVAGPLGPTSVGLAKCRVPEQSLGRSHRPPAVTRHRPYPTPSGIALDWMEGARLGIPKFRVHPGPCFVSRDASVPCIRAKPGTLAALIPGQHQMSSHHKNPFSNNPNSLSVTTL